MVAYMKRLKTLVVGSSITLEDRALLKTTLDYFIRTWRDGRINSKEADQLAEEMIDKLVFEDIVAKSYSQELDQRASEFGYLIALGSDAVNKLETTVAHRQVVELLTLKPNDWSGPFRDRVVKQFDRFITSWITAETEVELAKITQENKHSVDWILQNLDQFKRHIQLMIQNGRPHAVFFQEGDVDEFSGQAHVILMDATKRLKEPLQEVVPIVVDKKILDAQEKNLKKFEQNGYVKVFLMDIDEFVNHVEAICLQMNGLPAYIMVKHNACDS